MTEDEKRRILGKTPTPELYYRLDEFKYSNQPKERVLSGIRGLDYLTKGFEMGVITIWTGFTNAGKTTVMTMLAKKAIEQGERIFFFNGEQTKEDFKNKLYIQASNNSDIYQKQFKDSCVLDDFVRDDKVSRLEREYGSKIYVYNNEASRNIDVLIYAMEELRRTQKIRVFFLDNFMQIDIKSSDVFQEQTNIMEKLRTFAINKKVHIHLVAHPRKIERGKTRLSLYDIAGSSNLTNKAYNIISILRVDTLKEDSKGYEKIRNILFDNRYCVDKVSTVLEVLKTKGNSCGFVGLSYDKVLKTYSEAPIMTSEIYEKSKRIKETEKNKGGLLWDLTK